MTKRIKTHLEQNGWTVVEEETPISRGKEPQSAWLSPSGLVGAFRRADDLKLKTCLMLLGKIDILREIEGYTFKKFYPVYKLPATWMHNCIVNWEPLKILMPEGSMDAMYWIGPLSPGQYTEVQRRAEKESPKVSKAVLRALGKPQYV